MNGSPETGTSYGHRYRSLAHLPERSRALRPTAPDCFAESRVRRRKQASRFPWPASGRSPNGRRDLANLRASFIEGGVGLSPPVGVSVPPPRGVGGWMGLCDARPRCVRVLVALDARWSGVAALFHRPRRDQVRRPPVQLTPGFQARCHPNAIVKDSPR